MTRNSAIIGIGDVFRGDEALGCYVVEALSRELRGAPVELTYLGDDPRWAGGFVHGADLAIIVGALDLGGPPGRLQVWNYNVFKQHQTWIADEGHRFRFLMEALTRLELADGLPGEILFLWVQPQVMEGYGMSNCLRKAVWRTIRVIKQTLVENDFLSREALSVSTLFRIESVPAAA